MAASWDDIPRDDLAWSAFERRDFQLWEAEYVRRALTPVPERAGRLVRGVMVAAALELVAGALITMLVLVAQRSM